MTVNERMQEVLYALKSMDIDKRRIIMETASKVTTITIPKIVEDFI